MKQSLKFIIGFLLVSITINNCQRQGSDQSFGNQYLFTKSTPRIDIEPLWIKLGDHTGIIDKEMGKASVDVAEFSNKSNLVVSGASNGYDLIVWNIATGQRVWQYLCDDEIEVASFSPDDKFLLGGGKFNKLYIWNTDNWTMHREMDFRSSVESITFSHAGKYMALGCGDGKILLFNAETLELIKTLIHTPEHLISDFPLKNRADVNAVDFSVDDKFLISGGMDGKIKIWNTENWQLLRTLKGHNASVKSVEINPQKTCIASASVAQNGRPDNSIKIWNFETGKLIHTLSFPLGMEAVRFTPNGKFLAGGGREGLYQEEGEQGNIYFYSIPEDPINQPIMQVHKEPVFRSEYLHFNKKGNMLVSSHEDGTVRLWKVIYN
jgi:WD40 repeat protein